MVALLAGDRRAECAMVLSLLVELPGFRGDDARAKGGVDRSTIHRWVLSYTPELDKRVSTAPESNQRLVVDG